MLAVSPSHCGGLVSSEERRLPCKAHVLVAVDACCHAYRRIILCAVLDEHLHRIALCRLLAAVYGCHLISVFSVDERLVSECHAVNGRSVHLAVVAIYVVAVCLGRTIAFLP